MSLRTFPRLPFFTPKNVLIFIVLVAALARLLLTLTLPLWGDESFSIWAIGRPILETLTSITDPVHPPGYYLVLKVWSLVSDALPWLRLLGVVGFVLNCYLLFQLFSEPKQKSLRFIAVFLYCFSGYFVIFDWQVRMYTLALSFMLLLLLMVKNSAANWKLAVVSSAALFFDYACFWFVVPFTFLYGVSLWRQKKLRKVSGLAVGCGVFALRLLAQPGLISRGSEGIGWMIPYLNPAFHLPYFLGTHGTIWLSILFGGVTLFGMYRGLLKSQTPVLQLTLNVGVLVYSTTLIVSLLYPHLIFFHLRSLQIVPLAFLIGMAYGIEVLFESRWKVLAFLLCGLVVFNFYLVAKVHYAENAVPTLIVHFMPWKTFFSDSNRLLKPNGYVVVVKETSKPTTPLVLSSFYYSAAGKETLFAKPYPVRSKVTPGDDCNQIFYSYFEFASCAPAGH